MALLENERSMNGIKAQDADIKPILTFLEQAPAGAIYDAKKEQQKTFLREIPHVKDINEYASRMVEAEIAVKFPIPTIRRPLSVKRIISLFPTILG